MGIAQAGKTIVDGGNLAIQGVKPNGMAAQGKVIYHSAPPWQLLAQAAMQGAGSLAPMNTVGANLIVVFGITYGNPTSNLTDDQNNNWTMAVIIGAAPYCVIFYCLNPVTNSAHTITLTDPYKTAIAAAFKSPVPLVADLTTTFAGTGASALLPPIAAVANGLLVTAVGHGYTSAAIDSGLTLLNSFPRGTSYGGAAAYLPITNAASVSPTWTLSNVVNTSTGTVAAMLSFKPA